MAIIRPGSNDPTDAVVTPGAAGFLLIKFLGIRKAGGVISAGIFPGDKNGIKHIFVMRSGRCIASRGEFHRLRVPVSGPGILQARTGEGRGRRQRRDGVSRAGGGGRAQGATVTCRGGAGWCPGGGQGPRQPPGWSPAPLDGLRHGAGQVMRWTREAPGNSCRRNPLFAGVPVADMLISIAVMSAPEARGRVVDHIAALCSGPFRKRYRNVRCSSPEARNGTLGRLVRR
jgi:hypothetical protein